MCLWEVCQMRISSIYIQNFRKLWRCRIDFSKETTVFVGANNSGKTSAMDALAKFLANREFELNDFTISNRALINAIGYKWVQENCKQPEDLKDWESILPMMDVWLDVPSSQIHYVASIIPTLKWRYGKLGIRLVFQPKDIAKLFADFREAYFSARNTEIAANEKRQSEKESNAEELKEKEKESTIILSPRNLCDFLDNANDNNRLKKYFSLKSYVLDPNHWEDDSPQPTPYDMECFTDNPIKGLIRIDMIEAQRGFSDPDSPSSEKTSRRLSTQMQKYYDKHLDPEKLPTPNDLKMLAVAEDVRTALDNNLAIKFAPAIEELESLGYPGVTDPKITITTKFQTKETLKHDSAVQYSLSTRDDTLKLPEKYNGLGYQNLISIVFNLMSFRDGWMRVGKAIQGKDINEDTIEPLHLVLIEEPEAHLHMQVQQVFIRKAYSVLRNKEFLKNNEDFATQMVISTHSSHIARESNFADLRYFKRLPESDGCNVPTAKVINLSDVFGHGDDTDRFVTRYLQTTHCDLFFADAAILVEGSAESMLVPHFIRHKFPELYQRYISILSINGRHSHRLGRLINKLCLPTLIISDLDSVKNDSHRKAARPERNKGLISGNYAITQWLIKERDLDKLLDLSDKKKEITQATPYKHSIRIAYQTPIKVTFNGQEVEALSSTFEDCLIYTNFEFFKRFEGDDVGSFVKKVSNKISEAKSFEELHRTIYDLLRNEASDHKAQFALDLIYAIDPSELIVPSYIAEGLEWLQTTLRSEEG